MNKTGISAQEVSEFKEKYCNENVIIAEILNSQLSSFLAPTILDVGAGLGDIAYNALQGKRAILLDVNQDYELSNIRPQHKRITGSIFEYEPEEPIETVFISHTLQFLDESVENLNSKLNRIGAKNLILVTNTNMDFMGKIILWLEHVGIQANPEVALEGFPYGYSLKRRTPFTATITCPNFRILAMQISYLMLFNLEIIERELILFLQQSLTAPTFQINQTIDIYEKDAR